MRKKKKKKKNEMSASLIDDAMNEWLGERARKREDMYTYLDFDLCL